MKILFVMNHPAAVRSFGSVLRLLDERGHRVHMAFRRIKTGESHRILWDASAESPGLTFGKVPGRGSPGWVRGRGGWEALAGQLRYDADYLRYLEAPYADAPGLRARAERRARPAVRRLARVARLGGRLGILALRRTLELVERSIPPPGHIERFVADHEPDVVLVAQLAELGSSQADYVRAAKRLQIHTGYPVFSWDNLTNKGLVHALPEMVLVWNDLQKAEAVDLHGIPPEQVRITGACAWDHWFEWEQSSSREEFCREVGLRADRPIVLYVCSSHFIAPYEVGFVCRWLESLRAHGGVLADAGILIRPHPRNSRQWADVSFDDPQVSVWPRFGEDPLDEAPRRHYFDSIYHSGAVVGINTSAQIESAIVGRPVLTVLADEFRETQQGTLHFHYLKADEYGHVYVGRTIEEHLEQLETSLRDGADEERNERFLRRFVRPLGLDVSGTLRVVEAIEELAARPAPPRERGPLLGPLVRLAARPLAAHADRETVQRRKSKELTPVDEVRQAVRKVGRDEEGPTVIAGPWLGDEIAELLYWIPFLRWAQEVTFGLRDRLAIVGRGRAAPWYAGIGSTYVPLEEIVSADEQAGLAASFPAMQLDGVLARLRAKLHEDDLLLLPAALVDERRAMLATREPAQQSLARLLEFVPLSAPELPAGIELPDDFVVARFVFDAAYPRTDENTELAVATVRALAEHAPVVLIDPPPSIREAVVPLAEDGSVSVLDVADREVETAIIARARGFVGSYGVSAYLAVLLGIPAVGLYTASEHVAEDDLRLAGAFFQGPPFGRLHAVEASGSAGDASARAATLLRAEWTEARPASRVGG